MAERTVPMPPLGWPLFALPDDDGALHWPALERSVRDSLQAILATRPGEQLMRPDFGAGLDRLLHEQNTPGTRRAIQRLVQDAIARWEPRIVLDRVDVLEVADDASQLRVELAYRLVRNGAAGQLAMALGFETR
jgi:hypothetical protein